MLHRDFKPSNVIVGTGGRAKVADFGLAGFEVAQTAPSGAAAAIDPLTKTGAIMGTLAYMAPELLDGGKASFVGDQFAFCVTMYEVLSTCACAPTWKRSSASACCRRKPPKPEAWDPVLSQAHAKTLVKDFDGA